MTALLPIALGLLLQSTVLLLVGLLALWLARRRGPAVQSLVGRATLAGVALTLLLAAPLTGHVRPLWRVTLPVAASVGAGSLRSAYAPRPAYVPLLPDAVPSAPLSSPTPPPSTVVGAREQFLPPAGVLAPTAVSPAPPPLSLESSAPAPRPSPVRLLYVILTAAWGLGTGLLLLWLGVCQWHLSRLCRQAQPITSGPAAAMLAALTPRPPRLLCHPSVQSPFLAGLRHPALFLPAAYEAKFSPTALRAILAHELAHLARRDTAWTLAARLLSALLWPQPLLWVLCRRLEQIGEEACDQAVLAHDCPPRAYADCLLTLAERHPLPRRERALGAGVAPFRSSLGQRIGRILDKGTHAMSTVSTRLRLTIAALTIAAALGGAFLVSSAPAQVSAASAQTGKPSLIGTWLCTHDDGTGIVMIFSTDGRFEEIGPWPGESRVVGHSYGSNQEVSHSYGPYSTEGQKLTYTDTRVWVEGEKPWRTDPYEHIMDYSLTGDVLTLRLKDKWVNVYHRVPAYAEAMIGIKPNTSPDVISAASDKQLGEARFLAGLTPVQGPGVVVTLNDSQKSLPSMPSGMAPPNIIHDSDINQVVNELKAAGAEAIAVNDQRLVATSSVRTAGPTILINFTPTTPPFVVKAIGSPKTLATALNMPGGVASQLKSYDSAMFSVKEARALTLLAYTGTGEPRYAKPISAASADDVRKRTVEAELSRALIQKRDQLKAQLRSLDEQAASLTARIQMMRIQARREAKGLTPLAPPGTNLRNQADPAMQALAAEIVAARKDMDQKEASGMTPQHPSIISARNRLKSLEKLYQEQPIKEKYQFVKKVHEWNRRTIALLNSLADKDNTPAHQLSNVQKQQRQLQATIAVLNVQIAHQKVLAPGH